MRVPRYISAGVPAEVQDQAASMVYPGDIQGGIQGYREAYRGIPGKHIDERPVSLLSLSLLLAAKVAWHSRETSSGALPALGSEKPQVSRSSLPLVSLGSFSET